MMDHCSCPYFPRKKRPKKGSPKAPIEEVLTRGRSLVHPYQISEAVTQLNASVTSHLRADRSGDSAVVQLDIVEERIGHVAVAVVGPQKRPGEVGMVEHVEEIKAHFQLVTFKRQPESLVQAQVHCVDYVAAENVSARDVISNRRVDDV